MMHRPTTPPGSLSAMALVSSASLTAKLRQRATPERAHGELLIFVDADTIVNEAVVRAAVDALRAGAVGGGAAVAFEGAVPLYGRLLLPVMVRLFRATRWAAGCFVFCTRAAFVAAGGFDEAFYCAEELVLSRALKRQGRFVVLRQSVTTSGRKLRTHRVREILPLLGRVALGGSRVLKQRHGKDLWYAERREDPQAVERMPAA
jgi:GT2 family glycosyltransferase